MVLRVRGGVASGGGGGGGLSRRRFLRAAVIILVGVVVVLPRVVSSHPLSVVPGPCEGDDVTKLTAILENNGYPTVRGCAEVSRFCTAGGIEGGTVRNHCCATCAGLPPPPPDTKENPPPPPEQKEDDLLPPRDKPLELYLLGGQSECDGKADPGDLLLSKDGSGGDEYPGLRGTIGGVWFAGYRDTPSPETFFVGPMSAGVDGRQHFGPEVSFGERIHNATGGAASVMVVKYCKGGTNVNLHWNPEADANLWDESGDDGTAAFLEPHTVLHGKKYAEKTHQFVVRPPARTRGPCLVFGVLRFIRIRYIRRVDLTAIVRFFFLGVFSRTRFTRSVGPKRP